MLQTTDRQTDTSLSHKRDRTKYGRLTIYVLLLFIQLIQEAIDHGDTDKDTMHLADYWLLVSMHFCAAKSHHKVRCRT